MAQAGGERPLSQALETPILGRRALNRALLARQLLVRREALAPLDAVERFIGLQAQSPSAPYFALAARLEGFRPEALAALIEARQAVRIALMRSTLHLVSARDCLVLRPWLAPTIERLMPGPFRAGLAGLAPSELIDAVRLLLDQAPYTREELGALLAQRWPERDPRALSDGARTFVPLVQVPPRGLWGRSGQARHVPAERWLGQPLAAPATAEDVLLRYLAAFGPASVRDMQAWSGASGLRRAFDRLRERLIAFRSEDGEELFDLPETPRPDPDTPAPARFLGEFDNVLLAHGHRRRMLDDAFRPAVLTNNGIVRPVVLLDGFVAATWQLRRERGQTRLIVASLRPLSKAERRSALEEGERVAAWAAAGAGSHGVAFVGAG